ncbi:MAG: 23S rRNA (pseudouridine(1915)-N(3))-methyltransferase RlmH [Blastochloris viridis]|uniref:Ribosomal RNA large subunit methyltransferase H n=1 Tax=Blastochloris viridis TaxID=1079 RepID=A0A6N4QZT8_BLAVI|nr:MAG: 23S rRNA (pseudouridine(1915)-N(3))-methyltransferase RlmH [Blastochloris viridis]
MQLLILTTGKCRDAHLKALESQYLSRLPDNQWRVVIRELPDGDTPEEEASAQMVALAGVPMPGVRILLDEIGENVSSRELAGKFQNWQMDGVKAVAILIGGANGISKPVLSRVDWVWSLGKLTYPHQMVRLVLAEQLYRMHTIIAGHPYHRD